ncbi:MAG: hypothetical protein ACHQJ6_00295 [Candidatus Berkiellales bacterium]
MFNTDELFQDYLARLYHSAKALQSLTPSQIQTLTRQGICITYGEMLYPSMRQILKMLRLSRQDIFLDLGSGLGKCALQTFMQTEVNKVIGIEAASFLHQQAIMVAQEVKKDFPFFWEDQRELIFVEENFLTAQWHHATVVYSCSTCFTQELLVAIGDRINQQPSINQVLSLRPLPTLSLPLKSVYPVECSWDSALCFHYARLLPT